MPDGPAVEREGVCQRKRAVRNACVWGAILGHGMIWGDRMSAVYLMFGVIAGSFAMMVLGALGYRAWRKRDQRRSPLNGKLHHVPGQQLLDRIAEHEDELSFGLLVMYLAGPLMLMAWAVHRIRAEDLVWRSQDWMFVVAALLMFCYGLYKFAKHWDARQNARDGMAAERMAAQQLNRLIGAGCHVLHDIPGDGFNIDHVVVSPTGVFAVETKSMRKARASADDSHYKVAYDGKALAFPGWRTAEPIEQARRQAQWLAKRLRETLSQDVPVIPAVALPGWYIEPTRDASRADVRVFTPMGRGATFMVNAPERLSATQRGLIAQALALRYPDAGEK